MHRWTLQFKNPSLEKKFQDYELDYLFRGFQNTIKMLLILQITSLVYYAIFEEWTLSIILGVLILLSCMSKLLFTNYRKLIPLFQLTISLLSSSLILVVIQGPNEMQISIMDVTLYLSIGQLTSNRVLINVICHLIFIAARTYFYLNLGLYLQSAQFIIVSAYFLLNDCRRIRFLRQLFLMHQINNAYEDIIHFLLDDSLIVANFDEFSMKFQSLYKSDKAQFRFSQDVNEVFKSVLLQPGKRTLQDYLFKNFVQGKAKSGKFQFQGVFKNHPGWMKIRGYVTDLNEQRFMVTISKINQGVVQQVSPLYQGLLKKIKKLPSAKGIYQAEIVKNLLLNLVNRQFLQLSPVEVSRQKLMEIISIYRADLQCEVQVDIIITDIRLLIGLFSLFPKKSIVKFKQRDSDTIQSILKCQKSLTLSKLNWMRNVLEYAGIPEVRYIQKWEYEIILFRNLQLWVPYLK